jgi:hypothetical protein
MMLSTKSTEHLYEMATGENGVGESEREQRINRVRDRALDRYRYVMVWKWPLVKKDT